jgi:hypothetical protein|tara:strand:- start:1182 stop:2279 length:1098 start_codon:yes stop_codon:yes gene_type:complete
MLNNKKNLQKYFKSVAHKIFKIIYGNIEGKITHLDHDDISLAKVKVGNVFYEIFNCIKCSYYTDRIHDSAVIKNNKIVEGPSFQLRENTNADCLENSVIKIGTPRIRKKIKGTVITFLTGGGGNTNYWHWMFDVLPRIKIYQDSIFSKKKIDYYLFPNLSTNFQKETLDLLDISINKRLSSEFYRHFYANQIIVPSHPYTLQNDPELDSLKIPIWLSDFLKLNFLNKSLQESKIKKFPKKIYISRKDATSLRYIINEKEVDNALKNKGFSNLTMSDYSFKDQVALFHNAEVVIGLHGAGFANIVFCKTGTKIIEMRSNTAGDVIKNLAISNKLIYHDISCIPKTINYNNQLGDIQINLENLKGII